MCIFCGVIHVEIIVQCAHLIFNRYIVKEGHIIIFLKCLKILFTIKGFSLYIRLKSNCYGINHT